MADLQPVSARACGNWVTCVTSPGAARRRPPGAVPPICQPANTGCTVRAMARGWRMAHATVAFAEALRRGARRAAEVQELPCPARYARGASL